MAIKDKRALDLLVARIEAALFRAGFTYEEGQVFLAWHPFAEGVRIFVSPVLVTPQEVEEAIRRAGLIFSCVPARSIFVLE